MLCLVYAYWRVPNGGISCRNSAKAVCSARAPLIRAHAGSIAKTGRSGEARAGSELGVLYRYSEPRGHQPLQPQALLCPLYNQDQYNPRTVPRFPPPVPHTLRAARSVTLSLSKSKNISGATKIYSTTKDTKLSKKEEKNLHPRRTYSRYAVRLAEMERTRLPSHSETLLLNRSSSFNIDGLHKGNSSLHLAVSHSPRKRFDSLGRPPIPTP